MKKFAISSMVVIGLLGNSVMASASTVDYSQGKEMASHLDKDVPVQKSSANLAWAVGGYVGGKVADAVGNWVGNRAEKAHAQSIYSAAGKGKYACYRSAQDPAAESVASFGR
ncbi:hypothetical protein [Bacillus mycoides]|uniref:hypothetical protein n=1 Tax=Bacillus mycoides TaxID=1405 RepID=UPI003D649575